MHEIIGVIVYAEDKEDALLSAKGILDDLCGEELPFDFYSTFDESEEEAPTSGKQRFGDIPPVMLANSKDGAKFIATLYEKTRNDIKKRLTKIKSELNKKDIDKIINDKNFEDVHYNLFAAGQYKGPNVLLYDDDGEGIYTADHLENALNKWKESYKERHEENPYEDLEVYIVPADVHY